MSGVVGVITSAIVIFESDTSRVTAAVIGLVGWHLAYALDCADGQLARATGRTSPGGAVLDLLIDFAVHTSVALAFIHFLPQDWSPFVYASSSILIVAALLYPLYWEGLSNVLPREQRGARRQGPGALIHLVRDYALHATILPVAAMLSQNIFVWTLGIVCAFHYLALLGRIFTFSRGTLGRST
jgi:phosphatidylglycerophosphate synthase